MTRQVVLRHPSSARRHPLLSTNKSSSSLSSSSRSRRLGEVAGGTAAEVTAVACCCPCALLNIIFLAVYKVPASLCKRALRRQKSRKGITQRRGSRLARDRDDFPVKSLELDTDVIRLEKEMWEQFDGTGFWRSPSQREKPLDTRRVA